MKIIDKCTLRDKKVSKMLRDLESHIDKMESAAKMNKENFMAIFMLTMDLLLECYRQIENNTTPAKTLLDYTGMEVRDAVFRVGAAKNFDNDADYVMAVMQELTK